MAVRGVRGATTATANTAEEIIEATQEMLEALIGANEIDPTDIASAFFTTTADLTAEFPAYAAGLLPGWQDVPRMCAHEMNVPGRLGMCIRVLLQLNTEKSQAEIRHLYLRGSTVLRPEYAMDTAR